MHSFIKLTKILMVILVGHVFVDIKIQENGLLYCFEKKKCIVALSSFVSLSRAGSRICKKRGPSVEIG